jgi:hypothetical protein
MRTTSDLTYASLSAGEAALSGILIGGLAGIPMAVYMAAAVLLGGFIFYPGMAISTFVLMHLAVSSVYGLLYSLAFNFLAGSLKKAPSVGAAILAGLFYASVLLILAVLVILPSARSAQFEIPLSHIAIAHGIYAIFLSLLIHYSRFKQ